MKFYCEKHGKDVYPSRLSGRVECYIESETEKHNLGRFPEEQFWEYCDKCDVAWRSGSLSTYQARAHCPRCGSKVTQRYLCDNCGVFTFKCSETDSKPVPFAENRSPVGSSKSAIKSKCPGCGNPAPAEIYHHDCETTFDFWTPLKNCPFCRDPIRPPPEFPTFVSSFLDRVKKKDKTAAGFDLLQIDDGVVIPDPEGEFIIVSNGSKKTRSILLPRETRIERFDDQKNFSHFYDSEGNARGDIKILSPATVKKIKGGWVLVERGRLTVGVETAALSSQSAFPKTAADYLNQYKEKIVTRFEPGRDCFVRDHSNQGAIVIVEDEAADYALPRLTQFAGEQGFQQYFKRYFEAFYDCIRLGAGDVWIQSPAVVRKVKGGWVLFQRGVLEIRASVQTSETSDPSSETIQPKIGTATFEERPLPSLMTVTVPDQLSEYESEPDDATTVAEPRADENDLIPAGTTRATENNERKWIIAAFVAALLIIFGVSLWSVTRSPSPPGGNANTGPSTSAVPENMVKAPGGKFTMGNDRGDDYEKPAHEVTVQPFFLDKYEVTCEQYARFVNEKNYPAPPQWKNGTFPAGWARRPVTGVTWDDANAYAQWAGKRLPTEEEWEFAARGITGRLYPWGNEWISGAANVGSNSNHQLTDVGEYSSGASPFGAFDMVGNAWEWTASKLTAYPGGHIPKQPKELMVIRGGSWREGQSQATATYRGYLPATGGTDYSATGFRCVKDVSTTN